MQMPAELRTKDKTALIGHAKQTFNVQLNGNKTDVLKGLEALYAKRQEVPEDLAVAEVAQTSDNSDTPMGESLLQAADNTLKDDDAEVILPEPVPTGSIPEVVQTVDASKAEQIIATNVQPEVIQIGKEKDIRRWPADTKWLYNPKTKCVFEATPALRERMDLVPCQAPQGDYKGY